MKNNRSIPRSTVIPEMAYPDVPAAASWLCQAFGFQVRLRIADHRIQLNVGDDGAVVVVEMPKGGVAHFADSVMVRIPNVNIHHDRAKAYGAQIIRPPQDYPYGERQYSARDLVGRVWTFTETIADADPRNWGGDPGDLI